MHKILVVEDETVIRTAHSGGYWSAMATRSVSRLRTGSRIKP